MLPILGLAQGAALAPLLHRLLPGVVFPLLVQGVPLPALLVPSYVHTGSSFWLSPLSDPLAAIRTLLGALRTPTRWRGRTYAPSLSAR